MARYDYQIKLAFPERVFFQGPQQKHELLEYLKLNSSKNLLVITDNHLSCDIPNEYKCIIVHHGCAKTTAIKNPSWGEPWKSLCCEGQNKMLSYRNPNNTTIISISQACTDDFTKYYGKIYTLFKRYDILHSSELDEHIHKTQFNTNPIILGNWGHVKKGLNEISILKNELKLFQFKQLNVRIINNNIDLFNKSKQTIYYNSDIFLQLSTSEGNSYATLDAMLCGMVVISTNVGLFYKDVPDDCFVKLDWTRINEVVYIQEKLEYAWKHKERLSKNARKWYLAHCRFTDWKQKMIDLVRSM